MEVPKEPIRSDAVADTRAGKHCTPKERARRGGSPGEGGEAGRTVSLNVLKGASRRASNAWQKGHSRIQHSRVGVWRTIALVSVHVIIAAHVVQWLVTGMTLSPLEPSESMQTLREGTVNAGFVLFAAAGLSTIIFGRFFCGWSCHVVALQDLCNWGLMKAGIKPKPFRSRLMVYMPLALGLYMFAYPVVHREVIRPLFADRYGRLPSWLGQSEPLPSLKTEFFVPDFWATFPTWYVAIPFIFVIGFAIVYVMGAKGFCTFGCPYAALFGPGDLVAPGKIRVNDRCEQCGHCTAVCTSNVRVHEEVRDFGMVVDPGCMKCLDCISVCPNDALYYGFGAPTALAKPRDESAKARRAKARAQRESRFDMTRREDLLITAVFVAMFLAFRGMMNEVPMLMAVAMAAMGAFITHKFYRCFADPSVRFQNLQLKIKGRWTRAGRAFGVLAAVTLLSAAWSGAVRWSVWRANETYAQIVTPWATALRDDFVPSPGERERAEAIIRHYRFGGDVRDGGIGWRLAPEEQSRLAHAYAIVGDIGEARARLEALLERPQAGDGLVFQVADLQRRLGVPEEQVRAFMRAQLEKHPNLDQLRAQVFAMNLERAGGPQNAAAAGLNTDQWRGALSERFVRASSLLGSASSHAMLGERDQALAQLKRVPLEHHDDADSIFLAARMAQGLGDPALARTLVDDALRVKTNRGLIDTTAAGVLLELGEPERAADLARRGVEKAQKLGPHPALASTLRAAGLTLLQVGSSEVTPDASTGSRMNDAAWRKKQQDDGLDLLRRAIDASGASPWDLSGIGVSLAQIGMQNQEVGLLQLGLEALERARDRDPKSPTIRHDLAQVYYATGRLDRAVEEMRRAAEMGASSAVLARRYAELLSETGKDAEAQRWIQEAEKRERSKAPAPGAGPGVR